MQNMLPLKSKIHVDCNKNEDNKKKVIMLMINQFIMECVDLIVEM